MASPFSLVKHAASSESCVFLWFSTRLVIWWRWWLFIWNIPREIKSNCLIRKSEYLPRFVLDLSAPQWSCGTTVSLIRWFLRWCSGLPSLWLYHSSCFSLQWLLPKTSKPTQQSHSQRLTLLYQYGDFGTEENMMPMVFSALLLVCLVLILSGVPHSESLLYKDLEEVAIFKEVMFSVITKFAVGIVIPLTLHDLINSS